MFCLDICGYSTKKVHAILGHGGKNHPIKNDVSCETNKLNHVYTFILVPGATYIIFIDNKEKHSRILYTN